MRYVPIDRVLDRIRRMYIAGPDRQEAGSTMTQQHWTTDPAAEAFFTRLGVDWAYAPSIAIGLVDQQISLTNQARIGVSIDTDVADEYAAAMADGAAFPALVAFPIANGTYVLAGGNHRLYAARKVGRKLVDLYVLRVNDESMRRLITTSLNTLVGVRPSRADTVEQAIAWMEMFGRTAKIAASLYGIPESSLLAELRLRGARKRLALAGVPVAALSKTTMARLAPIDNDIVLREAAVLQAEAVLAEPDLRRLVSDVRGQRTEAGQLAVVAQWRDRDDVKLKKARAFKGRGVMDPTTKNRAEVFRTLRTADRLFGKYVSRGQLGLSADVDYHEALGIARALVARLEKIDATPR